MTQHPFPEQIRAERSVLRVEGPDAKPFLHGILTCDVEAVSLQSAAYGALLSPQGKILFDVFITYSPNGVFIDCASTQVADLLKRLNMYKLRANVTISPAEELAVAVSQDVRPGAFLDPRSSLLGFRRIVAKGSLPQGDGYHTARIAIGLADTDADLGSGEFFPHEANFDQIGAVSFTKGCYIGQEVVSRMEHRGTARARIVPVTCDSKAPPRGCDIRSEDKSIGTMLGSAGEIGLALIRLDRLAEVRAPLLSEGVSMRVQKPAFARYDVPGVKD